VTDRFLLSVLTPNAKIFDGSVEHVAVSGDQGEFGVLPGHYPYITAVRPGALSLETKDGKQVWAVGPGFAQVAAEKVSIVVSSCRPVADIDVEASKQALAQAEKVLLDASPGDSEYTDAQVEAALALGEIVAAERLQG